MASKNKQLMTWLGSTDDFWQFIRRHRRLDARTIYLYSTRDPAIFVWSSKEPEKEICKAFRLKLHDSQIIPGTGSPSLKLVLSSQETKDAS